MRRTKHEASALIRIWTRDPRHLQFPRRTQAGRAGSAAASGFRAAADLGAPRPVATREAVPSSARAQRVVSWVEGPMAGFRKIQLRASMTAVVRQSVERSGFALTSFLRLRRETLKSRVHRLAQFIRREIPQRSRSPPIRRAIKNVKVRERRSNCVRRRCLHPIPSAAHPIVITDQIVTHCPIRKRTGRVPAHEADRSPG